MTGQWTRRQQTMCETTVAANVVISNPQGLHARPADLFVKLANKFESKIQVIKGGHRVDGKSILSILTLVAEKGTQLTIEATGFDAPDALQALVKLVQNGFASDEMTDSER